MGIPPETLKAWAAAADCSTVSRDAINAVLRRGNSPRGSQQAPPTRVRGMVGGDEPVAVFVPVRIVSTPNRREHHQARARLVRHQRNLVALWLGRVVLPVPPVVVTLTRVYAPRLRQQRIDSHDNYRAGCKAVADEVASLYGVDDGRGGAIEWRYGDQEAGDVAGVRIQVEPRRRP